MLNCFWAKESLDWIETFLHSKTESIRMLDFSKIIFFTITISLVLGRLLLLTLNLTRFFTSFQRRTPFYSISSTFWQKILHKFNKAWFFKINCKVYAHFWCSLDEWQNKTVRNQQYVSFVWNFLVRLPYDSSRVFHNFIT